MLHIHTQYYISVRGALRDLGPGAPDVRGVPEGVRGHYLSIEYAYMYVCMYIYIYIYTCIHIHISIYIYTYIYIYMCMYICMYVYMYTYILVVPRILLDNSDNDSSNADSRQ